MATNEKQDFVLNALTALESLDPNDMTEREMLVELVLGQREMRKTVKQFVDGLESNPMMKTMGRMFGGK